MQFRRTFALSAVIAVLIALPLSAQWPMTEKLDLDAIYRIKEEGLQRSKVMEIERYSITGFDLYCRGDSGITGA